MDQYQEELRRRLLIDCKELGHLQEIREREFQEQLQNKINENKQIQQENDKLAQENTALNKHNNQLQEKCKKEAQLVSNLIKKVKEVKAGTVSGDDDKIKSMENKIDKEKEEEKKLRQKLQEEVEFLQQQLQQFTIPQSGMCIAYGSIR